MTGKDEANGERDGLLQMLGNSGANVQPRVNMMERTRRLLIWSLKKVGRKWPLFGERLDGEGNCFKLLFFY